MLVLVLFISLVTSAYCDDTREIHGYSYFYTHGKPGDISLITRINVLPVTWGLAYCPTSGADPHAPDSFALYRGYVVWGLASYSTPFFLPWLVGKAPSLAHCLGESNSLHTPAGK